MGKNYGIRSITLPDVRVPQDESAIKGGLQEPGNAS